jgi:molybdopterin molybdotransferase
MLFETAIETILSNIPAARTESVPFELALGRVLAEDVVASQDVPPFRRSAVDGIALACGDTPGELAISGEAHAGGEFSGPIGRGQCVRITTGAAVPDGADAVQMIENVQIAPDGKSVRTPNRLAPGANFVPRGYEAKSGDIVLGRGRILGPAEIAVLATFGYRNLTAFLPPRVAILATGDELVEFDETPAPGKIRNSNVHSLSAQVRRFGIEPRYLGIARDTMEDLRARIVAGLKYDILILSGGASVGPYDLVKDVFGELGIEVLFDRIAVRPGKPTIFARKEQNLIFGLPGNPVSSFVSFENFVRPALGRMCGMANPDLMRIHGLLAAGMKQNPGRMSFLPARTSWMDSGWKIDPLPWKGSGDIIGFSNADSLVIFPGDRAEMKEAEGAEALLLPDYGARRR